MAQNFTTENFDKEVMNASGIVLVDFWASWCGPCRMVAPIIDQIDEESALASEFAVVSIPTIIIFKDGRQAEKLVGARSFDDFCDVLDQYI